MTEPGASPLDAAIAEAELELAAQFKAQEAMLKGSPAPQTPPPAAWIKASMIDRDFERALVGLADGRMQRLVAPVRDEAKTIQAGLVPYDACGGEDLWSGFAAMCSGKDYPLFDEAEAMVRLIINGVIARISTQELVVLAFRARDLIDEGNDEHNADWLEAHLPSLGAMQTWVAQALWTLVCEAADADGQRFEDRGDKEDREDDDDGDQEEEGEED